MNQKTKLAFEALRDINKILQKQQHQRDLLVEGIGRSFTRLNIAQRDLDAALIEEYREGMCAPKKGDCANCFEYCTGEKCPDKSTP